MKPAHDTSRWQHLCLAVCIALSLILTGGASAKESKEKEPKAAAETRDSKADAKQTKDKKSAKDAKDSKETKAESKDKKAGMESKDTKDSKEQKKEKDKKEAKQPAGPVDINSASQKDLESLKGIGAATAKKIIDNRPYKSIDELSKAGLSAKKISELKPFVTAGPASAKPEAKTPITGPSGKPQKTAPRQETVKTLAPGEKVNINTAPKEKIEALPGIGPVKAQAIIDGRPYKKPEDIMKISGIKQGIYDKIKNSITVQ